MHITHTCMQACVHSLLSHRGLTLCEDCDFVVYQADWGGGGGGENKDVINK